MESAAAVFAGAVFAAFGAGLFAWTGTRLARHASVVDGAGAVTTLLTTFFGAVLLIASVWCLLQV